MKTLRFPHLKQSGFTLIELSIVVLILAVLAGVLVPRIGTQGAAARDARRIADMKTITAAIEQYYADHGKWPTANTNGSYGGWDVSHDGNFIQELVNKGYLREAPKDPINDNTYHYRYYVYNKGNYGCQGNSKFYVLGVLNFETSKAKKNNPGFFKCASRDWSKEFAYVTGGGASWQK